MLIGRRARLGISVNLRARETDSIGAYVNSVTPNGPAWKAGIRSGDVITRLDGTPLLDGQSRYDEDDSAPGIRLTELAARLEPNDTIGVELRRGKERKTVKLVTGDEPAYTLSGPDGGIGYCFGTDDDSLMQPCTPGAMRFKMRDMDSLRHFHGDRMRMRPPDMPMIFAFGSPLADLELAPMNPDLGKYFGTTTGILVVNVPDDSKLNLKGGDVVLSVDGRAAGTPSQLLRILRSYEPDESFKVDIMREKKRMTVIGKLGDE